MDEYAFPLGEHPPITMVDVLDFSDVVGMAADWALGWLNALLGLSGDN